MGTFINISDFSSGQYLLRLSPQGENDLNSLINKYEKSYILKLFGVELGNLVYLTPLDYSAIVNPFIEVINDQLTESLGIAEMIKAFIYFEYTRTQYAQSMPAGVARKVVEGAENKSASSHDLTTRYNSGVDTWDSIQFKCSNDYVTYPTFSGIKLGHILPF